MTKEEIIEGNKLIAHFIADRVDTHSGETWMVCFNDYSPYNMIDSEDWIFHTSWDWLMPVVEKIENDLKWAYSVEISRQLYGGKRYEVLIHDSGNATYIEYEDDSKIHAAWLAVVDFIKWYNQSNPTHP